MGVNPVPIAQTGSLAINVFWWFAKFGTHSLICVDKISIASIILVSINKSNYGKSW